MFIIKIVTRAGQVYSNVQRETERVEEGIQDLCPQFKYETALVKKMLGNLNDLNLRIKYFLPSSC